MRRSVIGLAATLLLDACSTERQTSPARSAREQVLISTAVDRAAENLTLPLTHGTRVFVNADNFEGTDAKYAIAAIRDRLLRNGAALVGLPSQADAIVEIRAGALSIDETEDLFGIPSYDVPFPFASDPLQLPEIALYKEAERKGVVKIAAVAYDVKDGRLIAASDPQFGYSHERDYSVLFFSWRTSDLPKEEEGSLISGW